ncbi:MAG: V-type ATP synthase subunit F [Gammaproteobacteria bacterium SHHR-1]|uniref:V-type ATP synthase subunit F n=1 Tax=Magnetovirga frankeli TaxID=947516 RepID=UPI001AF6BB80|nr:ATPase [gamma proteobacterium SS-5]
MEKTALYFAGEFGLATGFRLAGFEVLTDASVAELEALLNDLRQRRQAAFVVLDQRLAGADSKILREVRDEGGRILITQVPLLGSDAPLLSCVDAHMRQMLGDSLDVKT